MADRRINSSRRALAEKLAEAERKRARERKELGWFARFNVRVRPGIGM